MTSTPEEQHAALWAAVRSEAKRPVFVSEAWFVGISPVSDCVEQPTRREWERNVREAFCR